MQVILDKYQKKGLFVSSSIVDGVLYNNVTSLLTSLLSAAKTVLYYDTISQFDSFSRGGTDGISITFDQTAIQTIQTEYSCARGLVNPCDSSLKKFTTTMQTL